MDKANTLKTWLPEGYSQKNLWIDRVIYDHALNLVKSRTSPLRYLIEVTL